jgi:DNA primase
MSLILDIVATDVALERAGAEFRGPCPFHSDAAPTFYVIPDKGVFHCFGCGAHGDAVAFVMRRQGLDFIDAAKLIGAAWT